ncbi:uncharacterized protein PFL1_02100 [Pseudozyma flocculosa PF-1]|uniref:Heme haloperoxidase family profile domain-containing protein n=1 Tax=Pseudozyma flocculosa TaxID=84751 RepID=A0A5C3F2J6_9BASI|nr:uncharacterized protein PFL1_02100 [Pseudozyma flocculosa PF-1]EPQ30576.1 hypothetical protein PFL1_02100 [Pseudozyma flocculosa PF-1]SPO37669.1 uncharacterized protein PSFLO_03145 [Pseudozyma flocculosa]
MSSLPDEPYYPPELLGDPVLFDWIAIKDALGRIARAAVGAVQSAVFWLVLIQVDAAILLANLLLPYRSAPVHGRAHGVVDGDGVSRRRRRVHYISHRRSRVAVGAGGAAAAAATGSEIVSHSFSPLQPPRIWHAPFSFLLCQLAFFFGATDGRGPEWLRWWSAWSGIGWRGDWGLADWPKEWDLRSPCPPLNALANHGILPLDGRGIRPHQLASAVMHTFNLSPTLALALTWTAEPLWRHRGEFDLSDLCAHNVVERDASLLRPDVNSVEQKKDDQAQEHSWPGLVDALLPTSESELLREAKAAGAQAGGWDGPKATAYQVPHLSLANLADAIAARRLQCAASDGQYSLRLGQKVHASFKTALLHGLLGGKISDLRRFVGGTQYVDVDLASSDQGARSAEGEVQYLSGLEHIPSGWQPASTACFGMTLLEALWRGIKVELAVGDTAVPRKVGWKSPEDVLGGGRSSSRRRDRDMAGYSVPAKQRRTWPPRPVAVQAQAETEAEAQFPSSESTLGGAPYGQAAGAAAAPERELERPRTVSFDVGGASEAVEPAQPQSAEP